MKRRVDLSFPLSWRLLFCGAILSFLLAGALVFFAFLRGGGIWTIKAGAADPRSRELRYIDALIEEGRNETKVEGLLSEIEKRADSVEEVLPALKRRRRLALGDPAFISGYLGVARKTLIRFPSSEAAGALAAEALLLAGETGEELRHQAERLGGSDFPMTALCALILGRNLAGPREALRVPGVEMSLSRIGALFPEDQERRLAVAMDLVLILILKKDIPGAEARLNALLPERAVPTTGAGERLRILGAEFFYDTGRPLRTAEILAASTSDEDLDFEADALFLGGDRERARVIWRLLAAPGDTGPVDEGRGNRVSADPGKRDIRFRAFYNLAAGSSDPKEEKAWLEALLGEDSAQRAAPNRGAPVRAIPGRRVPAPAGRREAPNPAPPPPRGATLDGAGGDGMALSEPVLYGLIRYTRLLETSRAIPMLEEGHLRAEPFLDLESLRRRLEILPPERGPPEVWLLLGRHPERETLCRWAVWYFNFQHHWDEEARLLSHAAKSGFQGSWVQLYRAVALLREGDTGGGGTLLSTIGPAEEAWEEREENWVIAADLGLVREVWGGYAAALVWFERAAALLEGVPRSGREAARVQVHRARCLGALRREGEARDALERALELDPDNLDAPAELRRMEL